MRPRPITKPRCLQCRRKKTKVAFPHTRCTLSSMLTQLRQCTYEKPSCTACIRSGLVCEYKKDLVFVSYAAAEDGNQKCRADWLPTEDNTVVPAPARSRRASPSSIADIPLATVNKQALNDGFLRRYYPEKTDWWMSVCSWVFPALDGMNYTPLKVASTALGSAMMGATANDAYYKQYSVQCYIKSMQQLRVRCGEARPREWFKVLLTSILLLTFGVSRPLRFLLFSNF